MTRLFSFLTEKPAIAPPVFVFQKDKAQKVCLKYLFYIIIVNISSFNFAYICRHSNLKTIWHWPVEAFLPPKEDLKPSLSTC